MLRYASPWSRQALADGRVALLLLEVALGIVACGGKQSHTPNAGGAAGVGAAFAEGGDAGVGGVSACDAVGAQQQSCRVPAGSFTVADAQASVATFALDRFEVTVGRFREFVDSYTGPPLAGTGSNPNNPALAGWDPAWNPSLATDQPALLAALDTCDKFATWRPAVGGHDVYPMNCVTWFEAMAFCAWDGGWLPSEIEWQYVASAGPELRRYPWGSAPLTPERASYDCRADGSAAGACAPGDLLPVGSLPTGAAKWGQEDLAGSLFEWVLDSYAQPKLDPYPAEDPCDDCADIRDLRDRVTRGGGFQAPAYAEANAWRDATQATLRFSSVGLRCARAAAPP